MPVPERLLGLLEQGEAFFLSRLATLADVSLAEPSGLPEWTRSHVAGHVARNADAIVNLLTWARTGIETPMYPSVDARTAGIEASARQAPTALRTDVTSASACLVATARTLPADAWDAQIRTARGRLVPAAEVPWMRVKELWVHAVDLAAGATMADAPSEVADHLLDEVASTLANRDDCDAIVMIDVDTSTSWRLGREGRPVDVRGSRPDLLAWLIGRADGSALKATTTTGRPPAPPRWL